MWKQIRVVSVFAFLLLLLSGCGDLQRAQGLAGDKKVLTRDFNIIEFEYYQEVQRGRQAHLKQITEALNEKAAEVKEENKEEHSNTITNPDGSMSTETYYEYPTVTVILPEPPLAPAMAYLQLVDENILKGNKYIFEELAILNFYNQIRGDIIVEGEDMSFTVSVKYFPVSSQNYMTDDPDNEPSMAAELFPSDTFEYIQNRGYFIDATELYESFLLAAGITDGNGNGSGYQPGGNTGFAGDIAFDESLTGQVSAWAVSKVGLGYSQGEDYHRSRRKDCSYCKIHPGTSASRFGPTHYDCSGLVYCAYKAYGIDISWKGANTAAEQARGLEQRGCQVGYSELAPGDLIYISSSENGRYKNITHVVMYIGDGKIAHAKSTKAGVRVDSLSIYKQSSFRSIVRPSGLK